MQHLLDPRSRRSGHCRLCGDYRYINKQILHDHQFIPQVRYEIEKLRGFKYFIDLDMVNSFHQFKLGRKTSENLSVITPWGTVRPVFMPEGVSPATGVLQGHMKRIFKDFEEWAVVIFDNFCIGGHLLSLQLRASNPFSDSPQLFLP